MVPDIEQTPEFDKCLKKLGKFRTIESDLETFKQAILAYYPDLKHYALDIVIIPGFGEEFMPVYKARKFRCQGLRSTQKIRLIYTYNPDTNKLIFIEIYFKGDREDHDIHLIRKYLVKRVNNQQARPA